MFQTPQGSDAWKELRRDLITGTDVSFLLSAEVERVYRGKMGKEDPIPPRLQSLFDWGHREEPVAAEMLAAFFRLWCHADLLLTGLILHQNGWLGASLDRIVRIETAEGPYLLVVEIKTTHKIPEAPKPLHRDQVQTQLECVLSPLTRSVIETSFSAPLLPFALLLYWSPYTPWAPWRLFRIEKDLDFPYEILKQHAEAIQEARTHSMEGQVSQDSY